MVDENRNQERIVLYNGSLEELNSRDSERQYGFVENMPIFVFGPIEFSYSINPRTDFYDMLKGSLKSRGLGGLVNLKTSMAGGHAIEYFFMAEGTPIKRIESEGELEKETQTGESQ